MNFQRVDLDDETTLKIEGSLDALTTPELRPIIEALVKEKRKTVVVEVSNLRLVDSSGVGAIVSLYKRLRTHGGKLKVIGLRDQPLAIFKLLRLDRVLTEQ